VKESPKPFSIGLLSRFKGEYYRWIKGIGLTAAGGALSYLLFPILNAYALQLGFFISMYGTLLALIRPGI